MNKILIIGSSAHENADNIDWTQPFQDIEKYDCMLIDLTSFPKNYPPLLFTNIGILKRTSRIFIRDNKEIFCVMDKPFNILFKKIPLNYSWMPFPQKLTMNPMLLGLTINNIHERFADYMKNVEKWDNEIYWKNTANCSFEYIATNKTQQAIAATITMNSRGKIHFLPKPEKSNHNKAINLLIKLATQKESKEDSELSTIDIPEINQSENLRNISVLAGKHSNLFSTDNKKITKAVQVVLKDLGIATNQTSEFDLTDLKGNIVFKVTSTKGKVDAQNVQLDQVTRFIEKQRKNEKIVFIANTYQELPINSRTSKENIDLASSIFLEAHKVMFLTTLSLFHLWEKTISGQITSQEAVWLIENESGETEI
ncbi:MAG: hypothetical protein NWF06_08165 [Candidatus Bathyarchaeota archaeon]|nr:hypothetical protein [Candidatus Bathyarchaeum sp.]